MNCPKCKYPNQPGATYCGMCYEVLNRSAADAFLRDVQRERLRGQSASDSVRPRRTGADRLMEGLEQLDWNRLLGGIAQGFRKIAKPLAWTVAGVAGVFLVSWMISSPFLRKLSGYRLSYRLPENAAVAYLMSFHQELKGWSERQGQLDTPFPDWRSDEIGNVLLQILQKDREHDQTVLTLRPKEWIQIGGPSEAKESHVIPLDHPSVSALSVTLDPKRSDQERHYTLSPRLAKGVPFLLPQFPVRSLRPGDQWSETVQWIETLDEWKIFWSARLAWTLGTETACGKGQCVQASYRAEMLPQIKGGPEWASNALGRLRYQGSAQGLALFARDRNRLYANSFQYRGRIRIPLRDLGLIPMDIRVGRRVRGVPGDVLLEFDSRIDIREP